MENQESKFVVDNQKAYIFLVLACLLAYANSLSGDFVFDDTAQIVNNQFIHSWQNVISAFTTDVWAFQRAQDAASTPPPYYRPLFTLYLTIGYQLFGLWQQGWHLLNLAIHTGATVLVYRLFYRLSDGNIRLSLIGGLLFALIPVHVESVSWISGIPDPLAALFYVPAIIFYVRWRENSDTRFLVFSLVSFFLSLLCKETPIVLPLLLLFWELTLNRKKETAGNFFAALKPVLPFAVPIVVYLALRIAVVGNVFWKHAFTAQTPPELIYATTPYVLLSYLQNSVLPFNLSLIYPTRMVSGAGDLLLWIPLVILAALAAAVYFFRRRITPLMWLAGGLFFVPLLPVLNLQSFHYKYILQDRYLYLPSIGFVLFIACLLEKLWRTEKKLFAQAATTIAVALCIAYMIGTVWQNRVWQSGQTLWARATAVEPRWWANHYNLGLANYENKDYQAAAGNLNEALKHESFDRQDSLIYNNLGLAEKGLGKTEAAEKDFTKALEIDHRSIEANVNVGVLLFDKGNYPAAEARFRKALENKPNHPSANYNLARTLAKLGRHKEAVTIYEKLLQTEKSDPELMYYAAVSSAADGQTEKAGSLLNEAAKYAKDETLKNQILAEKQKLK